MIEHNKPFKKQINILHQQQQQKLRLSTYNFVLYLKIQSINTEINEPLNIRSRWGNNTMP